MTALPVAPTALAAAAPAAPRAVAPGRRGGHPAALAAALAATLALAGPAAAAGKINWDALGAEFCRLSTAGNMSEMRPILTQSLARDIQAAAGSGNMPPARVLFQTYVNEVPVCVATTKSAAIVEIRRSGPGGAAPAWTEYLVIAPEMDGGSRIDDVLFATRRSDTLRNRLAAYAGG